MQELINLQISTTHDNTDRHVNDPVLENKVWAKHIMNLSWDKLRHVIGEFEAIKETVIKEYDDVLEYTTKAKKAKKSQSFNCASCNKIMTKQKSIYCDDTCRRNHTRLRNILKKSLMQVDKCILMRTELQALYLNLSDYITIELDEKSRLKRTLNPGFSDANQVVELEYPDSPTLTLQTGKISASIVSHYYEFNSALRIFTLAYKELVTTLNKKNKTYREGNTLKSALHNFKILTKKSFKSINNEQAATNQSSETRDDSPSDNDSSKT